MRGRILIVDDEASMLALLQDDLGRRGFALHCHSSAEAALPALSAEPIDAVLTDMSLPHLDGIAFCRRVEAMGLSVPVIVMTGFGSMDAAIAALRAGAFDFINKPMSMDMLALALDRAVGHHRLTEQVRHLSEATRPRHAAAELLGESPPMRELRALVERVAATEVTALITGESGTGKELVAGQLHAGGRRAQGPFAAINCAALPALLMESELFGHRAGAFTDARTARSGLLQQASGGTLFLDEVGELPLELQPKLLRALEAGHIRPLGAEREVPIDVRLVAATNSDLEAAVAAGRFREDLYYRLNVIRIHVPPLRARGTDVLLLAQHFLTDIAADAGKPVRGIVPAAARLLLQYPWPGNVRELRNCLQHAVALTNTDRLIADDLPPQVRKPGEAALAALTSDPDALLPLAAIERRYIRHVLAATGGNRSAAARILGLDRKTLYRKVAPAQASSRAS